jgi:hypothetical protein
LLWGNRDPYSSIHIAERLMHQVPGTELTRLLRVGHFPPIEAPAETANAINLWLHRVEAARVVSGKPPIAKQPAPLPASAQPQDRVVPNGEESSDSRPASTLH